MTSVLYRLDPVKARTVVLVVQPSPADFLLLERSIRNALPGIVFQWVRDGRSAITHLKACGYHPDYPVPELILLDLDLGLVNGLAVLKWIRLSRRCKGCTVIVWTGCEDDLQLRRAKELGADMIVTKDGASEILFALDGTMFKEMSFAS